MKIDSRLRMSSPAWSGISLAILIFLAACGDETTQINQIGMDVVASEDDLPECSDRNEGEQAMVKGERAIRVCMDGEWIVTASEGDTIFVQGGKDTVYVKDNDFSCTTKELADSSGLKIICNGDSIGVVLNGAKGDKGDKGEDGQNGTKGEDGHNGAGCVLKDRTDTTVTVTCGDSTMVIQLGHATADSSEIDTATISLEALEGYTQKGPFLKGSSVYLYELNGSLNQTNGNFTSVITNDDGRYRFRTRGLKYPYAMVVVDGYYRNEITGATSDAPIRLRAITDVSSRVTGSANVNLLTHLEYDRVNTLATGPGKLKLKEAKHKAQAEILDAFHFDTNLVKNVQSEDMDVFGKSDADAALLAVSVLLQGDGKAADLSVLLTELADDLVDGKWDGEGSAARRAKLADWAMKTDTVGQLGTIRGKVKGWGLGDGNVPDFEKFVRRFWSEENGLGVCGSSENPIGTVRRISNSRSEYYAEDYYSADTAGRKLRFICVDADSAKWRVATEIEMDRFDWNPDNDSSGTLWSGPVTGKMMTWDADTLRYANNDEIELEKGCVSYFKGKFYKLGGSTRYSKCTDDGWIVASDGTTGTVKDTDGKIYRIVAINDQLWMAENLNKDIDNSFCYDNASENCDMYGRLYSWSGAMDSAGVYSTNGKECGVESACSATYPVRGICPEGWHLPSTEEFAALLSYAGGGATAAHKLKSDSGWVNYKNGSDEYGFTLLPAGTRRKGDDGRYSYLTQTAYLWSSSFGTYSTTDAYFFQVDYDEAYTSANVGGYRGHYYSVRCLQDD